MKNTGIVFTILIFLITVMLAGNVFAATIDTPSSVRPGEEWNIDLNCPEINGWPGDPSDECFIEWTGPEDGNFIENDADPDPDAVNQKQVLSLPGDYNYTIKECPTGAPGSCGSVLDWSTIHVEPYSEVGTVWLRYRSAGPNMQVSGLAPSETTKVVIAIYDENNSSAFLWKTVGTDPSKSWNYFDSNSGYYKKIISLSSITPQTLNVRVYFKDVNNQNTLPAPDAEAVLEAYYLDYVQEQIDSIEKKISEINHHLDLVDGNIQILHSTDANFAQDINNIYDRLNNLDSNVVDLQTAIDDVNSDLNSNVTNLQSQIDALNTRLNSAENTLVLMNHGTIQVRFVQGSGILYYDVHGEAPIGATNVSYEIFNSINNSTTGLTGTNNIDTNNRYYFNNYNSNEIDVSGLSPGIYNLEVNFGGLPGYYKVIEIIPELLVLDVNNRVTTIESQIVDINQDINELKEQDANFEAQFVNVYNRLNVLDQNIIDLDNDINKLNQRVNDLNKYTIKEVNRLDTRINDLNNRLTFLESKVESMNHGTLHLAYDRDYTNGWLRVKGEAPYGATKAKIYLWNADKEEVVLETNPFTIDVNTIDNSYKIDLTNVNDWPGQIYQITVEFTDGSKTIGQWVNQQFYALAILADFQGFSFVESKTLNNCYGLQTELPINFKFGALDTANYDFNLVLTDGNITVVKQLYTGQALNKFTTTEYNTIVNLEGLAEKNWKAKLVTNTTESNDFNILIEDVCNDITSGIVITNPVENSITTMPYPYGSIDSNVYWTQSGDLNLTITASTNSQISANWCDLKYFNSSTNLFSDSGSIELQKTNSNKNGLCEKTINTSLWNNINHKNNSTELNVSTNVSIGEYPIDNIKFGIDNEPPTIHDVIPSAGAYLGGLHVDVNTEDNLSGIANVYVTLMDKNSGIGVYGWDANFNTDTNLFIVDFNTLAVDGNGLPIIPDGEYDINALVTDVAGNQSTMIVDPQIDNTKPVINSIKIITNPMLRKEIITIDSNVTDNLSGVDTVKATIKDINGTTMTLKDIDGNLIDPLLLAYNNDTNTYQGTFYIDTNWDTNTYTAIIDANDKAKDQYGNQQGNHTQDKIDVNLYKNYYFNIDTSKSGTAPKSFTMDGNFRDDLGIVPTDNNTILITSSAVADSNVKFDSNGLYTINTKSLSAGTYVIDLNYNTMDYNYVETITIKVNNPPSTGGGSGGGGGGFPVTQDQNEPEGEITPTEETGPDENSPTDEETGEGTADTNNEGTTAGTQPTEPAQSPATGLFGLGTVGDAGVGLLGLLALGTIIFIVWKKTKS